MKECGKDALLAKVPVLAQMAKEQEVIWINPNRKPFSQASSGEELSMADIEDASLRLKRFAPFIIRCFPETASRNGLIESDLVLIRAMQDRLNKKYDADISGKLLLKKDSHLAIAGSVKARGGIYEILKHTEDLALEHGLLREEDVRGEGRPEAYLTLADEKARSVFQRYTVQAGSTGNLGMSIGIMSAAVGFHVIVHMSSDAKKKKKDLLRSRGVIVKEYESDYSEAVKNGRMLSDADPMSYFVDDENSRNLFLGYAVAAKRLTGQLECLQIQADADHPLFVYIPCGVGGAPGGVTFGLRHVFGDNVHCFFAEPTQAPCMLAGMASGLQNRISVQDLGLSGLTHADGLAVGRPSGFVGSIMRQHLSGEFTIGDARLYDYMRDLLDTEKIFLEPSACAAFHGPVRLHEEACRKYLEEHDLISRMDSAAHIVWATGGSLVPETIRQQYCDTFLEK